MAKVTDEQLIDVIKKNAGLVNDIVKALKKEYGIDITRDAIYKRKESNPAITEAFIEAENAILDIAESNIIKAINKGEMKATMFYLRTKGKRRGYSERREITGVEETPIEINPFANWSREDLEAYVEFTENQYVCSIPADK